jgi:hypothetical protein
VVGCWCIVAPPPPVSPPPPLVPEPFDKTCLYLASSMSFQCIACDENTYSQDAGYSDGTAGASSRDSAHAVLWHVLGFVAIIR